MAGSKVIKVEKNKSRAKGPKGSKGKPKPVGLDSRPPLQRCPFHVSPSICKKFGTMMQLLICAGLPFTVLSMVELTMKQMGDPNFELHCVELFAGVKTVAKGFQRLGYKAATYEIKDDSQMQNMLDPIGFVFALSLCIRLFQTVGLGWFAPVCSTWVWINRGTSGRSQTKPLGNCNVSEVVRFANWMTARCLLIIYMMCSLMEYHPVFKFLSLKFKIYKVFIWMGAYGGHSPKGTWLYSNYECMLRHLYMPLSDKQWDASMVTKYTDGSGNARVCGGADLKSSQHYPVMFGRTIAETWVVHKEEIKEHAMSMRRSLLEKPRPEMKDIGWSHHANLRAVIAAIHG